jgi:pyrroline-5-carboxylate reductase
MKVTVIGCGKMGGGIAERLAAENEIFLFDHNRDRTESLAKKIGAKRCETAAEAISKGEVVLLAVKPQDLERLAKEVHREFYSEQLLVSCLAGVSTELLETYFSEIPVLRIMPNLAVIHGEGVVGLVDTEELEESFKVKATKLFSRLGSLHWLPESKIDAISSLTGSGPAFVCLILESMIEAGVAMGIDSEQSQQLVFQLINGTISTLKATEKSPAQLKLEVCSPGGTSIAGLITMEEYGVRAGIINTFLSTYYRNLELSQKHDED